MCLKIGLLQRGFGLIKRFFITGINEYNSGPDDFGLIKRVGLGLISRLNNRGLNNRGLNK